MTLPVKWYSNSMQGAMLLSSGNAGSAHTVTQGSLIALLKACLVTGFGSLSASSAVYDQAAATITFTTESAHAYQIWQVIASSGWNEAAFNGEFRVTAVTSNTVTVGLDNGIPTDASATGSGSVKIPGLGWEVAFEDVATYRCIFKRTDPSATDYMLYVDNSAYSGWNNFYGHLAKVMVVTGVTDISTFTVVDDQRWPCSHNYATPDWFIIGDSQAFFFLPRFGVRNLREMDMFGDIQSLRAGDRHHCGFMYNSTIAGSISWCSTSVSPYNQAGILNVSGYFSLMRSYHQMPGVVAAMKSADHVGGYIGAGLPLSATIPINPSDSGFYWADKLKVFDDASWRGYLPGLRAPYASPASFDKTVIVGVDGSMTLAAMCCRSPSSGFAHPSILLGFDLEGPWR